MQADPSLLETYSRIQSQAVMKTSRYYRGHRAWINECFLGNQLRESTGFAYVPAIELLLVLQQSLSSAAVDSPLRSTLREIEYSPSVGCFGGSSLHVLSASFSFHVHTSPLARSPSHHQGPKKDIQSCRLTIRIFLTSVLGFISLANSLSSGLP